MANKAKTITITTPKFRVSYPNVFEPRYNQLSKQNEYSCVALFPKATDLAVLKKAAKEAAESLWGPDQTKWPKKMRPILKNQEDLAKDVNGKQVMPAGTEAGAFYLNLKSKDKPGLVDQATNPIFEKNDFYAGCYARAVVNVKAYEQAGNTGISFYLQHIQKMADGEPLGSRVRAEDAFAPVDVDSTETNKTGSTSDIFG